MRTILSALLAASVLLSGCAHPNTASIEWLSPAAFAEPGTGVALLTVATEKRRVAYMTNLTVFDQATTRRVKGVRDIWVDMIRDRSDLQEYHGIVNALHLPPGTYYLVPSTLSATATRTPTFVFDVRAGETTYLGELFMTHERTLEGRFLIRDRFDRDIAVAREKNAAVEGRPVVKRLLRVGQPIDPRTGAPRAAPADSAR